MVRKVSLSVAASVAASFCPRMINNDRPPDGRGVITSNSYISMDGRLGGYNILAWANYSIHVCLIGVFAGFLAFCTVRHAAKGGSNQPVAPRLGWNFTYCCFILF